MFSDLQMILGKQRDVSVGGVLDGRPEDRSSDAVKIWNHIQAVMSGKRIICVPDATAGIADALIAAETMRAIILLMSELHKASCCEETYSSACLSSVARESFRVRVVALPRAPLPRGTGLSPLAGFGRSIPIKRSS
jgi:hypothetical protein